MYKIYFKKDSAIKQPKKIKQFKSGLSITITVNGRTYVCDQLIQHTYAGIKYNNISTGNEEEAYLNWNVVPVDGYYTYELGDDFIGESMTFKSTKNLLTDNSFSKADCIVIYENPDIDWSAVQFSDITHDRNVADTQKIFYGQELIWQPDVTTRLLQQIADSVTNGETFYDGDDLVIRFTDATGVGELTVPAEANNVLDYDALYVGGGGGGGWSSYMKNGAGGGAAGQVIQDNDQNAGNIIGTIEVALGAGGAANANGSNTQLTLNGNVMATALGGGKGGSTADTKAGTFGGGSSSQYGGEASVGPNGTLGGVSTSESATQGGGGAGASENGVNTSTTDQWAGSGGRGGNGITTMITGTEFKCAGGGKGGASESSVVTSSAQNAYGGGGACSRNDYNDPVKKTYMDALANTGSGGGGGQGSSSGSFQSGGKGGSGIVIFRFKKAS